MYNTIKLLEHTQGGLFKKKLWGVFLDALSLLIHCHNLHFKCGLVHKCIKNQNLPVTVFGS